MSNELTPQQKRLSLLTSREEITQAIEQINQTIAANAEKAKSLVLVIEAIDALLENTPDEFDEAVAEEAPPSMGQN